MPRRTVLLMVAFLLPPGVFAAEPEDPFDELTYADSVGMALAYWRDMPAAQRDASLREAGNSLYARRRLQAAAMLGEIREQNAREGSSSGDADRLLRPLLDDPDPVVRRVAAAALWGDDAVRPRVASMRRYADVLAAERQARELLQSLSRERPEVQYVLTRELIPLGHLADWELRRWMKSADEPAARSAALALQEIDARTRNIPPLWAEEIRQKLKRKVSFCFVDMSLTDALKSLSRIAGVDMRLGNLGWQKKEILKTPISLRLTNMECGLALEWFGRFAVGGLDYDLRDGALVFRASQNVDYTSIFFLDVRDLEAAGFTPAWQQFLREHAAGWLGDPAIGGPFKVRAGVLSLWSGLDSRMAALRKSVSPIVEYLNKERRKLGLQKMDWPVYEDTDW
ncbi:MAG: hypothetical protein NTW87_27705 [Planctomycetota bacterium]|nr:hypothetical protein [Planctomycetota bacterium]